MNKTIIIQGKIFPTTEKLARDLRKSSDARIIVSTWENEDVSLDDIDNCTTLFLKDPGPGPLTGIGHCSVHPQNFTRQLYGANQALELVDGGIVAKIRSDAICVDPPKDLFSVYEKTPASLSPLRNKIFISNVVSCVPDFRVFSPSDWLYVGEYDDIKEWFDIEEQSKIASRYVMCAEQIFCVSNLMKTEEDFDLNRIIELNHENKTLTRKFFKENFVFVGTQSGFGAIMSKYPQHKDTDRLGWIWPQEIP